MNQLTKIEPAPLVAQMEAEGLSLETAFKAALTGGISSEQLSVAKQLLAMDGERRFAAAFAAMQADLPTIVASSEIPNRGKYERFEDVMHQIRPALTKHGFSVSFDQKADDKRVTVTCRLCHSAGHFKDTSISVRLGGRADSETQADCKASTTAKRNALTYALNIVIRQDCLNEEEDASIEGGYITKEQAEELAHRLAMVNGDRKKFLELAEAESFETIRSGKYQTLSEALEKKERQGR